MRNLIQTVIALLMLAALGLKITYGVTPAGGSHPEVAIAWLGLLLNLAVAVLCLFLPPSRVLWLALTLLFIGMGLFSLAHWVLGSQSCGCFGSIPVAPLYTVGLNSVIVGMLAIGLPAASPATSAALLD